MLNDVAFIWLGLIGSPDNISFFVLIPLRFNARSLISFNCSLRHVQTSPRLIFLLPNINYWWKIKNVLNLSFNL